MIAVSFNFILCPVASAISRDRLFSRRRARDLARSATLTVPCFAAAAEEIGINSVVRIAKGKWEGKDSRNGRGEIPTTNAPWVHSVNSNFIRMEECCAGSGNHAAKRVHIVQLRQTNVYGKRTLALRATA